MIDVSEITFSLHLSSFLAAISVFFVVKCIQALFRGES